MSPIQIKWPLNRLRDDLWGSHPDAARSRELTPISVERHSGPRRCRAHTAHQYWELTYVFSGSGVLDADTPHALTPNTAVLVPPGRWHREDSTGNMDTLWVGLEGRVLRNLADMPNPDILRAVCPDINDLCVRLWMAAERQPRNSGPEIDGLTRAIVGVVLRRHREAATPAASLVERVVDEVRGDIARPLSVGLLAARCGFSEGHFHRVFRQSTGLSPRRYVEQLRLQRASHWLRETRMPVAQIARMVGYTDPLYFSRAFRKATGYAPLDLRRAAPRRKTTVRRPSRP